MLFGTPWDGFSSRTPKLLDNEGERSDTEVNARLTAASSQDSSWLSSLTDIDSRSKLDITWGNKTSDVEKSWDSFGASYASETSQYLLSLLHSASNNLLSQQQASELFHVISSNTSNRVFFKASIAKPLPSAKSIARTCISAAMECGNVPSIEALLSTGLDPNSDIEGLRHNLFVTAIHNCDTDVVQAFLDDGANVNVASCSWQATPLEAAAQTGRFDLVQLLLQAGADLTVPGRDHGASVLASAAFSGGLDLVQRLIDAGGDVHGPTRHHTQTSDENVTALHRAAIRGDIKMAELLLSRGADANALRYAAASGDLEMLQLLLDHAATDCVPAMIAAGAQKHSHILRHLVSLEL